MLNRGGLQRCEEAFERLLSGNPHFSSHVGVKPENITPAMVSLEAGFDKGYLKKSRDAHRALIARINAAGSSTVSSEAKINEKLRKAIRLAEVRGQEWDQMKKMLDNVLTQNLMLVEKVRELEKKREK